MRLIIFVFLFFIGFCASGQNKSVAPAFSLGNFKDDYGIEYSISDSLWWQKESAKYHIVEWNLKEQWILVKNDLLNPSEPGKYSRIDYMQFEKMEPFTWGFCYTVYDAETKEKALKAVAADRANPRKGCNGFPFSRLKSN